MGSLVTLVMLSKTPQVREVPVHCKFLNYVSTFSDAIGLHEARLKSLEEIDTPYFVWWNDDDLMPEIPIELPEASIIYGIERLYLSGNLMGDTVPQPWKEIKHKTFPMFIHKAICSTKDAKALNLPFGEFYTELSMYFPLAKKSWAISNKFIYHNNQNNPNGMRKHVTKAIGNSLLQVLKGA